MDAITITPRIRHRLSPYHRQLLVEESGAGVPLTVVCRRFGVSRQTGYRWLTRSHAADLNGFKDRSSRPLRVRKCMSDVEIQQTLQLRATTPYGPRRIGRLLGLPTSTVYRALRHATMRRFRQEPEPVVRYTADRPGDLVHLDVLHVATAKGFGHLYQFTVVDDCTRQAWATLAKVRSASEALNALKAAEAAFGYRFKAVMTDNDATFTLTALPQLWKGASQAPPTRFTQTLREWGVKHRLTRVRRPQTNGKVERFHRTIREEHWRPFEAQLGTALRPPSRNAQAAWVARAKALLEVQDWLGGLHTYLHYYNGERPHSALGDRTPNQRRSDFFPG